MPIRFRFNEMDWRAAVFLDKRQEADALEPVDSATALEFLRQRFVSVFAAKKSAAPDWLASVELMQERLQSVLQEAEEREEAIAAPEDVIGADNVFDDSATLEEGEPGAFDLSAIFELAPPEQPGNQMFHLPLGLQPESLEVPAFFG